MTKEKQEILTLSVSLSSGKFDTKINIPFPLSKDDLATTVNRWHKMILMAFDIGISEMDITFEDGKD